MHTGSPPGASPARQRDVGSAEFSGRTVATFTSCLSIPVEGSIPIEKPDYVLNNNSKVPLVLMPDSKRAPRKSKMDAIAALQAQSNADDSNMASIDDEDVNMRLRGGPPIPVKSTLDLSSVKTPNPKNMPSRPRERPFGLTDCPTFRPTPEQWKDPMAYVESISGVARKHGMCKIVPPLGWDMPFVTDTETFRFKTRLQRLNSIEASSRAKINFLEQLHRFHKQQGNPRANVPTIHFKPLDLWLLRKEVHKFGGFDAVTKAKKWGDLGKLLGFEGVNGIGQHIMNSYKRIILPFEQFRETVRNSPNLSPKKQAGSVLRTHGGSQRKHNSEDSLPSSPLTATSPLSEPPDESEARHRPRRSTRGVSTDKSPMKKPTSTSGNKPGFGGRQSNNELSCQVCQEKDRGEEMLLCDGCDNGYHIFCLDPPLTSIPRGQWFCHICLFGTGGDFGFDEGEEHSLSSFQARDLEFRRLWFTSHPPPKDDYEDRVYDDDRGDAPDPAVNRFGDIEVTETYVEKEFWRLLQSGSETVEVEYGADIHSTTHGSAMPTLETHPLNPYSKDPWNLNNIPIYRDSLLRYIKSDISGMTVPWTYVGMAFSTFCWHNEDHYTYSINYMHWGETKTWYSIPGSDAAKFEAAIRKEAPELFEVQPDLLFQLVTSMYPKRLKEAGVDVYACNQRAGEFVITFPKAYHAGFNHGLNFNEAVNFAPPDWLQYDLQCVKRYQEHRKLPVFSHDELLMTIAEHSKTIKDSLWLNDYFQEMVDRELEARTKLRELGVDEILEEEDRPEDQIQCDECKICCYLSQITCQCTNKVVCIDHLDELCKCTMTNRVLRKRYDDLKLQDLQIEIAQRAGVPGAWREKFQDVLAESACPSLQKLRDLLLEGEAIDYPLSELPHLRRCVTRADEWLEATNVFLKPTRKQAYRSRARSETEELADKPQHGLDELYGLLQSVETLGFDCPETGALKNLAKEAEDVKEKARNLLDMIYSSNNRENHVGECERLLARGTQLHVHLDALVEVEKIVQREQLLKELEQDVNYDALNLGQVRSLVARGKSCGLPSENRNAQRLQMLLRSGEQWEAKAKAVLDKPKKVLEDFEEFTKPHPGVPIDPVIQQTLMNSRIRGIEIEKQAARWLNPDPNSPKPLVTEVVKLVQQGEKEFSIPLVQDLRRTVDFAVDLEARCEAVLEGRFQHNDTQDIFDTIRSWRDYALRHLTMFALPNFDHLDKQLAAHYRWLETLPWWCRQHAVAHGKPVLDDVVESTRPEDDLPPNDEYFTCICNAPVRPPAPGTVSDAVQCDHCFARFHGVCAATGGSCPFCDHQHWNGTIHKERSWHFCYLPTIMLHAPDITKSYSEDWKQLEIIVHRVDRLSAVIGQFLSFASQPTNQRSDYIPQVRHLMRKLYKIQFAVSPSPEVSFGLDLAGLHRILAGQPAPIRMKKRRRPKFVFGQDIDKDWMDGTRCICRSRTSYLLNYPKVECELCGKLYHGGCVFFPIEPGGANRFMCPLCCIRKNRNYPYSEVRVKHAETSDPSTYVDTKEMLDTFSKDIIFVKLPPPYTQTLFVELIRFTPGQPDSTTTNPLPNTGGAPRSIGPPLSPHHHHMNGTPSHHRGPLGPHPHPHPHPSHSMPPHPHTPPYPLGPPVAARPPSPPPPHDQPRPSPTSAGASHIPPPPWTSRSSRWSNAAATAPPPSARNYPPDVGSPVGTPPMPPPPLSRKRKHPDADPGAPLDELVMTSPGGRPSPKKRLSSTPTLPPARSNPALSPSIAMMLSPNSEGRSPARVSHSGSLPPPSSHPPSASLSHPPPPLSHPPSQQPSPHHPHHPHHAPPPPPSHPTSHAYGRGPPIGPSPLLPGPLLPSPGLLNSPFSLLPQRFEDRMLHPMSGRAIDDRRVSEGHPPPPGHSRR